ncbi:MAG: site-specific tyrosine recombinase/integron integrase [Bacteroidales bacterium]
MRFKINKESLVDRYIGYLKFEKGLSDNTISAYSTDLAKLVEFAREESIDLIKLTPNDLHLFITKLVDLGINARSRKRILSGVKSFFQYLLIENYIESNPSELIESPRIGLKLPEVLSIEEIDRMIDTIDFSKIEGERNRAIIEVLYSCGLRVTELCDLKFADIFPQEGFIRVIGKGDKQRLVPISESALAYIGYSAESRSKFMVGSQEQDFVFVSRRGKPLTRMMIFNIITKQAELAGVKKKISPHTLRHSFATHLLERGANIRAIQQMMGHESITTTEVYLHLDKSALREAVLTHHPRNKKLH